jgi:hypothetical protein
MSYLDILLKVFYQRKVILGYFYLKQEQPYVLDGVFVYPTLLGVITPIGESGEAPIMPGVI